MFYASCGKPVAFADSLKESISAGHYTPTTINSIAWASVEGTKLAQLTSRYDLPDAEGFLFAIDGVFKTSGGYGGAEQMEPASIAAIKYVFICRESGSKTIVTWTDKSSRYINLKELGSSRNLGEPWINFLKISSK